MLAPLIGITCGTSANDPRAGNPQDRLNMAYSRAIERAGGAPVILPNLPEAALDTYLSRLDGIMLSGGVDLDPRLFGQEVLNDTVEIDGLRDDAEMPLIRRALEQRLPMFAICRGIQSLNVALGGTLYQDLPAQRPGPVCHSQTQPRRECTHQIAIVADSRMARIIGSPGMEVNSFHHQAIDRVAPGLRVVAVSPDGVIEAVEAENHAFVLAVQFHPEELIEDLDGARRLFRAFAEAAGAR